MPDVEIYLKEKLHPLYRVWYGVWVYWWPLWRTYISGPKILKKWAEHNLIGKDQYFLDFGCGTGDFTIPAARIVGKKGKVFALDCNPKQLAIVAKKARRAGVANVETILSEGQAHLANESVDIIWMCDVLHEIRAKREVMEEAYRLLKKQGTLIIYDSLKDKIVSYTSGLFTMEKQDGKLLKFSK